MFQICLRLSSLNLSVHFLLHFWPHGSLIGGALDGVRVGSGAGSGVVAGVRVGFSAGTGAVAEVRVGSGTGSRAVAGVKVGSGAGTGTVAGVRVDSGADSGAVARVRVDSGAGSGAVARVRVDSSAGTGALAEVRVGSGAGSGAVARVSVDSGAGSSAVAAVRRNFVRETWVVSAIRQPQDYCFSASHRSRASSSIAVNALLNKPHDNLASTAETTNFPGILVSFGHANNSSDWKVYSILAKQTLINSKASFSRKIERILELISLDTTIVPHKIRLLVNVGPQQQAFNEPGSRPSSHLTHSLPASAQPFTTALPASAPFATGPLASVSRG
ncbi:hypothetical protein ROHU_016911 [Labeo rohita]|uniref:Uncharacterized protein n=1 Tax=Labeo rohita TaxID=84645 RepID=A0A498NI95_LABRO|nr:hypothetical protein ROHU_016911 [Labeo rohita]